MRIAAFITCLALPVQAQSPEAAAGVAMERLAAAQTQLAGARTRSDRVQALTETVQSYEDGLAALRDGLRQVAARETALMAELTVNRAQLETTLGALQRIGRTPMPVVRDHPDGALSAARAGGIVADLTPALAAEVTDLRDQLEELARLRDLRADAVETLDEGLQGAQTARSTLGQAISNRTDLPQRFELDPLQVALLQASTETLDAFASGLAGTVPDVETELTASGDLALPVTGHVLPDDGQGRPGIRIVTAASALVTTPVAATLLYQGPLLDDGQVVVLEPAADVLFIIAGMEQTFGTAGQILPAGTPIGLMGGDPMENDGKVSQNNAFEGGRRQQSLYLEVREGQSPTNTDAWFALE